MLLLLDVTGPPKQGAAMHPFRLQQDTAAKVLPKFHLWPSTAFTRFIRPITTVRCHD